MERKYISVTDFTTVLKRIFYAEDMLKNVAVLGEVSGFKISGGHAYFTLKDKESALPCSCFYVAKTHIPKDGDSVICVGGPDFYQKAAGSVLWCKNRTVRRRTYPETNRRA